MEKYFLIKVSGQNKNIKVYKRGYQMKRSKMITIAENCYISPRPPFKHDYISNEMLF